MKLLYKTLFCTTMLIVVLYANMCKAQSSNVIATDLQAKSNSILCVELKKIDAINVQVIIMDCKSGEIKAMVNLVDDKSGIKSMTSQLSQSTGLMRPISLLAALEQGKVNLNDSVDTQEGMIDNSRILFTEQPNVDTRENCEFKFLLGNTVYVINYKGTIKESHQYLDIPRFDAPYGSDTDSLKSFVDYMSAQGVNCGMYSAHRFEIRTIKKCQHRTDI